VKKIPSDIRIKVSKIIKKVEKGEFTEEDIELILFRLRDYAPKNGLFKEIAHFVSHHSRNQGSTFHLHYRFYCIMMAFLKYRIPKKQFDISKPLEKWEFDSIIYQLQEVTAFRIRLRLGISRKEAIEKVKACIYYENGKYIIQKDKIPELNPILIVAFSIIRKPKPLCRPNSIIDDFINVLKSLKFKFDPIKIKENKDLLLLAIMVLMHKKEFFYDNKVIGKSKITMRKNKSGEFQNLILEGVVSLPMGPNFIIPVIESNIKKGGLISDELFVLMKNKKTNKETTEFDFNADLTINIKDENFALSRLESSA